MLGEKEEGQSDNTIELDKGAEHDPERCHEVMFALDAEVGEQDDGRDGNIELLHIESRQ